jgi:hypothetical protein
MALNTNKLKDDIYQAVLDALNIPIDEKSDSDEVKKRLAERISIAVSNGLDTWIRTATVTVQPGISVSTSAGAGVTTSAGTGTIS